jgi:hypothetical protein
MGVSSCVLAFDYAVIDVRCTAAGRAFAGDFVARRSDADHQADRRGS